jgi:ubiquitin-conjugating enzyme E2 D/E
MSLNNSIKKRLMREHHDIEKSPSTNVSAGPISDNISHWEAIIIGPEDTPYSGGIFNLDIQFPQDYPFKPPKIKFVTTIWHPNIDRQGSICLDILKSNWSPALTIDRVLMSICSLLGTPNADDPLNTNAAREFKRDISQYNSTVREYVRKYAQSAGGE